MERDFTHVRDIVEGIYRIIQVAHNQEETHYRIFNIGNGKPINLMTFIRTIEKQLGKNANLQFLPMQPGDVRQTWADTDELTAYCNYKPNTSIEEGIKEFTDWYSKYPTLK